MKTYISPIVFFLACTLSVVSTEAISEKKLYKLIDESGKTSFSDQINPEAAKYRRETLSKQGRVIDVTEQEKTKAQQTKEQLLNVLRRKQEKVIQNQKAHDESLLRTYHNKEEMESELKAKVQTIEAQRKLIDSELALQSERLDAKQKSAATYERNALPIPANLIEEIRMIQDEIAKTEATNNENLALQKKITDEYQTNIKRFILLTQPPSESGENGNKVSSLEEGDELGLFRCENDFQCKKAWEIARIFVDTYSTTAPDVNTDKLVMHALPTEDYQFSLSISKIISAKTQDQLFLDIHCRDSSLGKELCDSKKIQDLRSSFRPYVNERLSSKVPTP
jgi:hypothetical protein